MTVKDLIKVSKPSFDMFVCERTNDKYGEEVEGSSKSILKNAKAQGLEELITDREIVSIEWSANIYGEDGDRVVRLESSIFADIRVSDKKSSTPKEGGVL